MKTTQWAFRPAAWWQFWLPQSGLPGGIIMGAFLTAVLVILLCR